MSIAFNPKLAEGLKDYNEEIRRNSSEAGKFKSDPTASVVEFLDQRGIQIPEPRACFHAHVIGTGEDLPDEPERATVERYIYFFRAGGLFEFKVVPPEPKADDDFMSNPTRACACCNCCVFQI